MQTGENNEKKHNFKPRNKLIVDILASIGAGLTVAPPVSIIDRAIVENMCRVRKLWASIQDNSKVFLRKPLSFVTQKYYLLIANLYFLTYLTANVTDTFCLYYQIPVDYPKLFTVTCVNTVVCVLKDRSFAKMFCGKMDNKTVPMVSLGLWLLRDILTIYSSFI